MPQYFIGLPFALTVCSLAGSMTINTRVTRRSEETPASDKINTSEYFQQIFESPGRPQAKVCDHDICCEALAQWTNPIVSIRLLLACHVTELVGLMTQLSSGEHQASWILAVK